MKQKIYLLMLLFVAVFTLGSCSSDDDENETTGASIVGTWIDENDTSDGGLQFLSDGTCYDYFFLPDLSARMRYVGRYTLNGNKLTIHWTKYQTWNQLINSWIDVDTDSEIVVITVKITKTTLTFISMEGEDYNSPVVYRRK